MSKRARREVDRFLNLDKNGNANVYQVVVQLSRDVSEAVAKKTNIRHESPQVLLIHNGKCLWSASHNQINATVLKEALNSLVI